MRLFVKLALIALAGLLLGACATGGKQYDPAAEYSHLKGDARVVLDRNDIPAPFKGCTGTHTARSNVTRGNYSVRVTIEENNSRSCPPVQLN